MDGGQRQDWQADTWQVGGFSKEAQNVRTCSEKRRNKRITFVFLNNKKERQIYGSHLALAW